MRVDRILSRTAAEARPYQRDVICDVTNMFLGEYLNLAGQCEEAVQSTLVESPTGSGKTFMGHCIAKTMQEEMPDLTIGWVAMRRNLLAQAARENAALGVNVQNIHYVSMFDKRPEGLLAARAAGKPIMMVMDEAQHDAAESAAHLHNMLEPSLILGLTATPFRTDRMKLCFQKVVRRAGIHQLIQDGYLSRYESYTLPSWSPQVVFDHYMNDPALWGKSIFYFVDTDQCEQLMRLFASREDEILAILHEKRPDMPVKRVAELVVGSTSQTYREEQLERFKTGETACLVNCMVLTEGFDDPTLETAWVRDSSKGPTIQMAGRAFRLHPEWKRNRDKRFRLKKIVQSKATKWPINKTATADQQYVWQNDEWYSLKVNPHLALINHNARVAIAQTEVVLPKFITDKMAKRRSLRRIRLA